MKQEKLLSKLEKEYVDHIKDPEGFTVTTIVLKPPLLSIEKFKDKPSQHAEIELQMNTDNSSNLLKSIRIVIYEDIGYENMIYDYRTYDDNHKGDFIEEFLHRHGYGTLAITTVLRLILDILSLISAED